MQAFSRMQRNRSNLRPIKRAAAVLALFAYEIATARFGYLPPLLGAIFVYLIASYLHFQKSYERLKTDWYVAWAAMIFTEQIHGFYLFSSAIAFLLFYYFIADKLCVSVKSRGLLILIYVCGAYACTLGVNNLMAYVKNDEILGVGAEYALYILLEAAIMSLFFKGRLR